MIHGSDKEASYVPHFQLGQWEGHILASLPFYMLLLPLLLNLLKSRASKQALRDLAKVTPECPQKVSYICFLLSSVFY